MVLALIRFYQKAISPFRPPCCRFYPTCSSYALEAVSRFGAIRGGLMAVWRILRCNPLGKGGYEPVPERWTEAFFRRGRGSSGQTDGLPPGWDEDCPSIEGADGADDGDTDGGTDADDVDHTDDTDVPTGKDGADRKKSAG